MGPSNRVVVIVFGLTAVFLLVAGSTMYFQSVGHQNSTPPTGPYGFGLGGATRVSNGSGDHYNVLIIAAIPGTSADDLHLWVTNETGVHLGSWLLGLSLLAGSGCAVASYSFGSDFWTAPSYGGCAGLGPASPLIAGEVLSLTSSIRLAGQGYGLTCAIEGNVPGGGGSEYISLP